MKFEVEDVEEPAAQRLACENLRPRAVEPRAGRRVGGSVGAIDPIELQAGGALARRIDRPFAAAGRLALQPIGRRDETARRIGRDAPHLGRHPARDLFLKIGRSPRSEEHTSELQSLMRISYAGLCMQKKTHITTAPTHTLQT